MSDSLNDFLQQLDECVPFYAAERDFIGNYAAHLAQEGLSLRERAKDLESDERQLKIGIVGQTKVGKSSLLNALYFDGKEILPRASTPMTASLTLVHFGESPKAEICFYDVHDWKRFEDLADQGRKRQQLADAEARRKAPDQTGARSAGASKIVLPPEEQGALEVLDRAPANHRELLGKTETINAVDMEGLFGILVDYAGSKGRYTSLVKKIELHVPVAALRGVVLIDTPGLNDPIVSRSQVTRRYLGQCDAILVLSYAGSFLDATDMDLIVRQLPAEGVVRTRLVATKFDSALIQDAHGAPDMKKAVSAVRTMIKSVVEAKRREYEGAAKGGTGKCADAAANLEKASPAIPVSVMSHQISQHWEDLTPEEQNILDNLNSLVPGFIFDREKVKSMSGLDQVSEFIQKVSEDKEPIIQERLNSLLPRAKERMIELLDGISEQCQADRTNLVGGDIESLRNRLKLLLKGLDLVKAGIESAFDGIVGEVLDAKEEIVMSARDEKTNVKMLEEKTRTWEESYLAEKKSALSWLARKMNSGGYETRHKTKTEKYLATDDAVDNICNYVDLCSSVAEHHLNNLGNRKEITKRIKNAMVEGVDFSDPDFDQQRQQLIGAVQRVVNDINYPSISLPYDRFEKLVAGNFSDRVSEDDSAKLRNAQRNALNCVLNALEDELTKEADRFKSAISKIRNRFVSSVKSELSRNTEKLEAQLKDRESALEHYDRIIAKTKIDIKRLVG